MKKISLIFFLFLLTGLSGCTLKNKPDPLLESDYLNHDVEYKREEDRDCLRVLVKILTAVDNKDREMLKSLFSKEALAQIDNIDEKLDIFIETFPEWEKKYDSGFGGLGKHTNKGKVTRWVKGTFDFESGGKDYVLYFVYYTDADEDDDKLGMSLLQIYERYKTGYDSSVSIQGENSMSDIYLWDYTMDLADRKPLNKNTPFFVYEKSEEEKWEYLKTMDTEEVNIIIRSDDRQKYYDGKLYSYQINQYFVALHELRFAKEYIKKHNLENKIVLEGPYVRYFDNSLLNDTGNDVVIYHLADDERKKQYHMILEIDGDNVVVVNEEKLILNRK